MYLNPPLEQLLRVCRSALLDLGDIIRHGEPESIRRQAKRMHASINDALIQVERFKEALDQTTVKVTAVNESKLTEVRRLLRVCTKWNECTLDAGHPGECWPRKVGVDNG